jgi:hypothetical protein
MPDWLALIRLRYALRGAQNGSERYAIAFKLFGRRGLELMKRYAEEQKP